MAPTRKALQATQARPWAPFALLRVAALSQHALIDLAPPTAPSLLENVLAARGKMEALRPRLEDALYAVVPRVDQPLRSAALALRRDVHNGRAAALPADLRRALVGLSPELDSLVNIWMKAEGTARRGLVEAEACLRREIDSHLRRRLRALACSEDLLRPLALASPGLFEALRRAEPPAQASSTKLERALLAYAMRASTKTSPFSVFMHQAVLELDPGVVTGMPSLDPRERESRSYLNRGALTALHHAALGCCGREDHALVALNPTLRWLSGVRAEALVPRFVTVYGRLWRSERRLRVRLHPRVAAVLDRLRERFTLADLSQRLEEVGLTGEAARELSRKLFERGLLLLEPFCEMTDERPEDRFVERRNCCSSPAAQVLRASVADLSSLASNISTASSGRRRELLQQARQSWRRAHEAVGGRDLVWDLSLVLEDGYFRYPCGPVGGELTDLLTELAAALQPAVVPTAPYSALCEAFVQCFGPGGTCCDIVSFLQQMSEGGSLPTFRQRRECPEVASLGGGMPVPVSAFVQLAISAGQTLAVVNQVHAGCGWLTARMAVGESSGQRLLRARLQAWLCSLTHPLEPVDVTPCGDCNPLQAHPRLTPRSLVWPGERCPRSAAIPVEETKLLHDPETSLLELQDGSGIRLVPVYLGGTISSPVWGARYWLAVLGQPYHVELPEQGRPPTGAELELEHRPRWVRGRVVLGRESWWMRANRVRRLWYRHGGAARLADVMADRRALGMPRFLFAKAALHPRLVDGGDAHKPLWVDTFNPFCLELLEPLLKRAEWIQFIEMLPGPDSSWSPFQAQCPASELLVEMAL